MMKPPAINNAATRRSISNSPPESGNDLFDLAERVSVADALGDEVAGEDSTGAVVGAEVGTVAGAVGVPFIAFDAGESPLALTALIVTE
jgi:hypothetical protein